MFIESFLITSAIFIGLKKQNQSKKHPSNTLIKSMKDRKPTAVVLNNTTLDKNTAIRHFRLSITSLVFTGITFIAPVLLPISFSLLAYLSMPVMKSAWIQWRNQRKMGHDLLVSLLFTLGLLSGQLFALAIALFFYHLGKKLLADTQNHSRIVLGNLFSQRIDKVWIIRDHIEFEIPLKNVHKDDHIVVNTGGMVPIDGFIITGMALIDEQTLMGEAQAVEKLPTQLVFAGTQVVSGRIIIQVKQTGSETTIAKIATVLNATADYQSNLLTQGEKQANKIALPLISLSAITLPFLGVVASTGILNATFGNRLQFTAPLCVLNHLNLANQKGIIVKDGRALETLFKVDTILFDKTGTLTTDQPTVKDIIVCNEQYSADQLLAEAATAESKLAHPIAKAIVEEAYQQGLVLSLADDTDFQIGLGINVWINQQLVRVGSLRFIQQYEITIPADIQQQINTIYEDGHSIVFVAGEDRLNGFLVLKPTIRPEIKDLLLQLRKNGIKYLAIVSGDHQQPTKNLAQQLNMDDYFFEAMPTDKADIVSRLQQQGRTVCFVGDGINDSIAIKTADVSISLAGATTIAQDLAQIVFMNGQLTHLAELFAIGRSLEKNLQDTVTTLKIPLVINLCGSLFFGFGLMTTVIINNTSLLLALRKSQQHSLTKQKS